MVYFDPPIGLEMGDRVLPQEVVGQTCDVLRKLLAQVDARASGSRGSSSSANNISDPTGVFSLFISCFF